MKLQPTKILAALVAIFSSKNVTPVLPGGSLNVEGEEAPVDNSKLGNIHHVFTFTLAGVGTNVIVGIFGKAGGETLRSQVSQNLSTITSNGRFAVKIPNTPLSDVALKLVTITGGTPVIDDVEYIGSR